MSPEKSLEDYRKGAIGSILDEYEKALSELKSVVKMSARKIIRASSKAKTIIAVRFRSL